jgi:hypothetical protein
MRLPAAKRVFFWRQNTAGMHRDGRYFSLPKHSMRGIPDIIALKAGRFIGIEVKAPKGKLSPDQAEFVRLCVTNGGDYIVARSIDDVIAAGL